MATVKIGIPKGLLYPEYGRFLETFFMEAGAEIAVSPNTNREILDLGVNNCVDEACLPMKIFHGHVCALQGSCDAIVIPRIMRVREHEYICPKFCGLTEMVSNTIPGLPRLIGEPASWTDRNGMLEWAERAARPVTRDRKRIRAALDKAIPAIAPAYGRLDQQGYPVKVALLGHPYNILDPFLNMDLIRKLNHLNIGVVTADSIDDLLVTEEAGSLFKRPFWTFARVAYGAASYLRRHRRIDGIVYVSSFACGIDSVVIELIRMESDGYPFLVLKIDEHTGEAGFDTRLEAFADLFLRKIQTMGCKSADNHSASGERISRGESAV